MGPVPKWSPVEAVVRVRVRVVKAEAVGVHVDAPVNGPVLTAA